MLQDKLSKYSKALSHPVRIEILKELAIESKTCGQIVSQIPLAQSTISQHLKELKSLGLINCENIKSSSIYSIDWQSFQNMSEEYLVFIKLMLSQKSK